MDVDGSRMSVSSSSVSSAGIPFSASILRIDGSCVYATQVGGGLLESGVKLAGRVGHSRKAEGRFVTDTDLSWDHQVAVMLQIISTLALELPSFLEALTDIQGVSPCP